MKRSKIGYCDFSGGDLNFVTGCTQISAGCRNCYAKAIYERFGRDFSDVRMHPDKLRRLQRPRFECFDNKRSTHEKPISKPIAFVCDTGDLFHPMVSDKFILQALAMMWNRRETTWLVLTKRAKRLYDVLAEYEIGLELAQHIWFGVTTENQEQYSERYEWLAQAPVALRWISVEPMLEAVCLADMQPDWVVCGGESGSNRRPFSLDWAKDLKRQCDERGITFFGKQGSGLYPGTRLSFDGRECKAWPR